MNHFRSLASAALIATLALGAWAQATPDAQSVLQLSLAEAKQDHKNVLVDFGASWCPWCRKLESLFDKSEFASTFHDSYVIAHITVRERPDRISLENAGWEPLMLSYRHIKDRDIPYVVILSPSGKVLGDSYEKVGEKIPSNAGYPQTPDEILAYLKLIRRTGKAFSDKDVDSLKIYLTSKN